MNKKVKALWVAALRSGEYKQARGQLRVGDAFCCLGVLCNLHAQAHPEVAAAEFKAHSYMGRDKTLPLGVVAWADLTSIDPRTHYKGGRNVPLSELNDGKRLNFNQIADIIEAQL